MLKRTLLCLAIALTPLACGGTPADGQDIKRTILQKSDVPVPDMKSYSAWPKFHPAPMLPSTTTQHRIRLCFRGQPDAANSGAAGADGQSRGNHFSASRRSTRGRAGSACAKVLAAWVVERDKPLASPVK
jgi:hypothetical protein